MDARGLKQSDTLGSHTVTHSVRQLCAVCSFLNSTGHIPLTLTGKNFMKFFINKTAAISEKTFTAVKYSNCNNS